MAAILDRLVNPLYFAAGVGFLAAAKVKNRLRGYTNPRPFSEADTARAIVHDLRVVSDWEEHLRRWDPEGGFVDGADILELGPGGDLGVPFLLLGRHNASSYSALDVHRLALAPRAEFYQELQRRVIADRPDRAGRVAEVMDAVGRSQQGLATTLLNYQVRGDFDLLAAFRPAKFNLFLSNAAFEHFDDPMQVLEQMTELAAPRARLCLGIDFKAHSPWIREKDPLNIYRYSPGLYKRLSYRGSPNRCLLPEYLEQLRRLGWTDIKPYCDYIAPNFDGIVGHLHKDYQRDETRYTWVVLCARRA